MCSRVEEAESLSTHGEDSLLRMLVEAVQELKALQSLRDRRLEVAVERRCQREEEGGRGAQGGGGGKGGEEEDEEAGGSPDEEECIWKVMHVLREVSMSHSDRVTSWREVLRECACILAKSPPEGSKQPPAPTGSEHQDGFSDVLLSIEEDVQNVKDKLVGIIAKLNEESLKFHKEASDGQTGPSSEHLEDKGHLSEQGRLGEDSTSRVTLCPSDAPSAAESCSKVEEKGKESSPDNNDADAVPQGNQRDNLEETREKMKDRGLMTVGLTCSGVPDACFIRGPPGVADALWCDVANALSCLMVCGSEELVSRVIRIRLKDGARLRFPVTVVVPFCGSYRGSYRDVVVKMVDKEGRRSYVAPLAIEGTYGGQWGSFAEVRVYCLGLFAVVSCLKKENYTVPTKGLSLKLNTDPRICLNYLPGCFAAPVIAQTMIQPMDTTLLAAAKSRTDAYHSVVSTSPVLYLIHPSSQPLRRPLALILPCPPNPQKKQEGGQEESAGEQTCRDTSAPQRRSLISSVKTKVISDELLVVLGSSDNRWAVLDEVAARNLQKGLVTFELTESVDRPMTDSFLPWLNHLCRLLVLRLLSPLQPCDLTSLAEELEESVHSHAVTLVLQRRPDEPDAVLVAALPSRDLSWELTKLRARGYGGLPEASTELSMCEGDQLVLQFSGNITTKGCGENQRLTFHSQLQSHILLHLTEVDPFGNYSSPHYKGTAIFYKVARERLKWRGGAPPLADTELLDDPVCKLSLTLPKRPRTVKRQNVAWVKSCEEPDSLSDSLLWLSAELSEEEVSLLVPSLRLCRSAAQLVKLRAGDSPSAQAFHVLAMWRRGLPAVSRRPKTSQLARGLARIGRPDLAGELLLRQAEASRQKSEQPDLKAENWQIYE